MATIANDFDEMIAGSSARDRFLMMLLERIDKLETEHNAANDTIEYLKDRLQRNEDHLKKILMRNIIESYREGEGAENYIFANNYYLKELHASLDQWRENTRYDKNVEDVSAAEALLFMQDFVIGVVEGNQEPIVRVGRYLATMSVQDMEGFMTWNTMPDLV